MIHMMGCLETTRTKQLVLKIEPKAVRWSGVQFISPETDNWRLAGTPRILQDAERCGLIRF